MNPETLKIAVIGLGYVGLPLAVEFGKQFNTLGFDINAQRIAELQAGHDRTLETTPAELAQATRLRYTLDAAELKACNVFIVTVPNPVDHDKRPDFTPLIKASETVGRALMPCDTVIYESTVYPGATEEICVPELERPSGLAFNTGFTVGYSPERINPGDKVRRLTTIPKVTSGSTPAADTKWKFLPFKPGLVGGHCIGVEPYYLIQKAQSVGYYPDIFLASRTERLNHNDRRNKHHHAQNLIQ